MLVEEAGDLLEGSLGFRRGVIPIILRMACPSENTLYVAELLNWRVQKLILKP